MVGFIRKMVWFLRKPLLFVLLGVTVWGGQFLYVAYHASDPIEISCADYLNNKPDGICSNSATAESI
jgi:hypothetical protein